ncbi:MAG: DUF6011 domain-containing protein [Flavobacterium sp.]|uniref:DUF6011 domain-containing protein n=1 Tax=Flavobacterium sp. TaxID=239 RepID=UPI0022C4117D|nr:DUF6011 domain-containing protein [Flavobacterium sp.]MCZ8168645.1 DUF6011 domain-containing protein [Flavobacterium sp.]MCZ8298158.1 DUF6011 domain-containing protein [Flavobacterium sp.]
MKRVSTITKELNISLDQLIDSLKGLGYDDEYLNINTRIPKEVFEKVKSIYIHVVPENDTQNELEISFQQHHSFEKALVELTLQNNTFDKREEVFRSFDGNDFTTLFNDDEAFLIALGLEDKSVRTIANRYFQSKTVTNDQIFLVHQHAMAAYKVYGGAFLTHLMALPKLPFKALDAFQLFNELDKRKTNIEFPIVRFTYKNQNGIIEHLQMSFDVNNQSTKQIRNSNVIVVKNKSTGKVLFKVDRKGYVLPVTTKNQIVPVLQYFIQISKDTGTYVLNYGLETGYCSRCGRSLTDKESVRIGMGPSCLQYGI